MAQLHFELVTPERLVRSEDVYMVVVPGTEGDMGVLAEHAPVMTSLRPGATAIYASDGAQPELLFIDGGFAEVNEGGLTIMAEAAGSLSDFDAAQVDRDLADAVEDVRLAKTEHEATVAERQVERLTALKGLLAA